MPAPAIEFAGVVKRFGATVAVDQISLAIDRGSFVALVGASGSGKTTLLKLVNRLIEPDAGTVHVDGRDIAGVAPAQLRRGIGYVFQGIGLFPHRTVADNIATVPRLLGWDAAKITARVAELLDLVDLDTALGSRAPAALSGGQRQRVGVARALAAAPSLMLMDEPFGALDPLTRAGIADRYRALHDRLGLTSVVVTHDMHEALLLADRVVVVDAGRVAADASPGELLRGHPDARVAAMIDTPRAQAERIAGLAARG